jgi:hypothetical protein
MIDTDKYEGHTPGPWVAQDLHRLVSLVHNAKLMAAAPDLLAEVKRFEQVKKWVYAHTKYPTITKVHLKDLIGIIKEEYE